MERGQLDGTLGVGIDTREIGFFKTFTVTDSFVIQNFTKKEIKYCFSKTKPAFHLAKLFAVKNAVLKAAETSEKIMPFLNIEVSFKKNTVISFLFENFDDSISFVKDSFNVSLSHKKDTVTAVVVREKIKI